jgi:hypothetical protein
MKNRLIILLLLFIFISCNQKKDNRYLSLFNNISFITETNERPAKVITPSIKDTYQSLYNQSSIQIPLFKCIQANEYTLYIGLPYNTSISKLIESQSAHQAHFSDFRSDSLTYYYLSQKTNDVYLAEYTVNCNGNLIYVLAETKNSAVCDSLFNFDKLSNRFVYEKK